MASLEIGTDELTELGERAMELALNHWKSVDERPAIPVTSGAHTLDLFSRPWPEDGIGAAVLDDFTKIANLSRPSGKKFFAYVFGSGEPVSALGELLAAALNQNVGAWRSVQ